MGSPELGRILGSFELTRRHLREVEAEEAAISAAAAEAFRNDDDDDDEDPRGATEEGGEGGSPSRRRLLGRLLGRRQPEYEEEGAWAASLPSADELRLEAAAGDAASGGASPDSSVDGCQLDASDRADFLRASHDFVDAGDGPSWSGSLASPEEARIGMGAATTSSGRRWRRYRQVGEVLCLVAIVVGAAFAITALSDPELVPDLLRHNGSQAAQDADDRGGIRLTSPAFGDGRPIPPRYTADGEDVSPPLSWSSVPPGTKALALLCTEEDNNGENLVNWVAYDIPPILGGLGEGIPHRPVLSVFSDRVEGFVTFYQGPNSWGDGSHGYRGPDPSRRSGMHQYVFRIFALDEELGLDPLEATMDKVLKAMKGVGISDYGVLVGTYQSFR